MKKYIYFLFTLTLIFPSCEEENLNNIAENQFVVEAFLYAGESIDDIRVKSTFSLTSEEDLSIPINDATVSLFKDGERFNLIPAGDEGYYKYPGTDISVETGDLFELEVVHNGITASATTMVPSPTTGLSLSQDSIFVPVLPIGSGVDTVIMVINEFLQASTIDASWDNPQGDLYFMVVESVGDTIIPIFPTQVTEALSSFRFVSEPTNETSLSFLAGTIESFGTYSVRVYHINQEYADLYENREQDSRDLNEPPSNITNALGVFSAFNSQEAFFEVVRE